MKVAGIIAEYNPFHSGHSYHIQKTRQVTGADYVIAVMSGNFVQRGEPACTDKYFRTFMALSEGADLVIELPVVYATASAEYFATAGVKLLTELGCVDYLSFGSEWAVLSDYKPYVDFLSEEEDEYQKLLKTYLKAGDSFPLARSRAIQTFFSEFSPGTMNIQRVEEFLKEPNHILGLEYLKALNRLRSGLLPVIVKREGAAYHELSLGDGYPSAAAIRNVLRRELHQRETLHRKPKPNNHGKRKREPDIEDVKSFSDKLHLALGENASPFIRHLGKGEYVLWDDLMYLLDYEILMHFQTKEGETGRDIFGVDKELLYRIRNEYQAGLSFDQLIRRLHTKNRTDAALKRALLHILLQIKQCDAAKDASELNVPYARVLGFCSRASALLKRIREYSRIPIIQRPAEGDSCFRHAPDSQRLYQLDFQSANLYEQIIARRCGRKAVSEMARQQIILK